jgi:hypothetical protein
MQAKKLLKPFAHVQKMLFDFIGIEKKYSSGDRIPFKNRNNSLKMDGAIQVLPTGQI